MSEPRAVATGSSSFAELLDPIATAPGSDTSFDTLSLRLGNEKYLISIQPPLGGFSLNGSSFLTSNRSLLKEAKTNLVPFTFPGVNAWAREKLPSSTTPLTRAFSFRTREARFDDAVSVLPQLGSYGRIGFHHGRQVFCAQQSFDAPNFLL